MTSAYASEEARRNLREPEQRAELEGLLEPLDILRAIVEPGEGAISEAESLPEKDRPMLLAAVGARATHL